MATTPSPITCHVLDTTIGRPGAGISVALRCLSEPNKQFGSIPQVFTAKTNSDGRIREWDNKFGVEVWAVVNEGCDDPFGTLGANGGNEMEGETGEGEVEKGKETEVDETTVWSLKFDTEAYYGRGKTFWPYVELVFRVRKGEHYHVPLLLTPHSYTTYRGS